MRYVRWLGLRGIILAGMDGGLWYSTPGLKLYSLMTCVVVKLASADCQYRKIQFFKHNAHIYGFVINIKINMGLHKRQFNILCCL